jgi:hypothetical protein
MTNINLLLTILAIVVPVEVFLAILRAQNRRR